MFLSALARALYLPGTSDGRDPLRRALASFALCLCWEVPSVVQMLAENGSAALLTPELLFRLGLCCVGVLGGLCAVRCCRAGQVHKPISSRLVELLKTAHLSRIK